MNKYDSKIATLKHIGRVRELMREQRERLKKRARVHDQSKLKDPEKLMFDIWTPKLRDLEYGSDEYKQALEGLGPALQHHYEHNSHHPEHWPSGINAMNIFDLLEMLADWKAAGERHGPEASLMKSIEINQERFEVNETLMHLLISTAEELGWL